MTLEEFYTMLKATGLPVAYSHFNETVEPPFIAYLVDGSSNFFADNKVYQKFDGVRVELYTTKKDLLSEGKLESVLDANEIPYETFETFIQSENLYQKTYEVIL